MFGRPDIDCLLDQQHRNVILDAVGLAQPWVVEDVAEEQQRSPVNGAHQDAQQLLVQHGGYGVAGAGAGATAAGALLLPGIWPAPITALFAPC